MITTELTFLFLFYYSNSGLDTRKGSPGIVTCVATLEPIMLLNTCVTVRRPRQLSVACTPLSLRAIQSTPTSLHTGLADSISSETAGTVSLAVLVRFPPTLPFSLRFVFFKIYYRSCYPLNKSHLQLYRRESRLSCAV